MKEILTKAAGGALFASCAVISGSIAWTLMQGRQDRRKTDRHWQLEYLRSQPSGALRREAA